MPSPELLCIGFFCHDQIENDYILGGTASYASIMASSLGLPTAVLTSVGSDFRFFDLFENQNIQIHNKLAPKTTVFQNNYRQGRRTQFVLNRAETLHPEDLPEEWKNTPIVKFCLIADEVDYSLLLSFPEALIGATIQGWLRQWDDHGKVSPKAMDWNLLRRVDIVFMSVEDIAGFESAIPQIIQNANIIVMTNGEKGVKVFKDNQVFEFPVYPVIEVDPTGAGDIFATAFLIQYYKTRDIRLAAAFANAAASFIVEQSGIQIPDIEKIELRYQDYLEKFA